MLDRSKLKTLGYAVAAFAVVFLALRLVGGGGGGGHASQVSLQPAESGASGGDAGAGGGGTSGGGTSGGGTSGGGTFGGDTAGAGGSGASGGGAPGGGAGGASWGGPPGGGPSGGGIVVDVAGEVARPGVYMLARGARAGDAVERAGGLTRRADPVSVNLAAPLQDGQQVVVPRRGAGGVSTPAAGTGAGGARGGAGAGAPGTPISLSRATVDQLDSLDGIGPTLAQRIVAYRDAHGGFRSVDELQQVPGIGDKRFAALRKLVQP